MSYHPPGSETGTQNVGNINFFMSGPVVSNSNIGLFAAGPITSNANVNLFGSGPNAHNDAANLCTTGPDPATGVMNLFTSGPHPASGALNLFAPQDPIPSGDISLFIYNDKYAQPSGDGEVAFSTTEFFISGRTPFANQGLNLVYPSVTGSNAVANNNLNLFITTDIPPTGDTGRFLINNAATLYINPNNDSNAFFAKNQALNVYLKNEGVSPTGNNNLDLYMERPTADQAPLFISSVYASGDIPLFVSGMFAASGSMDLYVLATPEDNIKLFTRGFS